MTISQAVKIICAHNEDSITDMIFCLINDVKISKDIIEKLSNKKVTIESYDMNDRPFEEVISYYDYSNTTGKVFLQDLIEILSDIDKDNLCKFGEYLGTSKESISRSENKKDTPSQIIINNENNNTANANASNENIITISTLSQLSNQVSQSTTIENKIEIQKLISQLEDAKDEGNEESYFDLFFKLLDKLSGSGLIPEWLVKSAKFAQKFINK